MTDKREILKELRRKADELERFRTALINMLEDVAKEREKAEKEKDKTSAIITNLADGLLFFDRNKNLLLINPQVESFLNVQAEEVVNFSIFKLVNVPNFSSLVKLIGKDLEEVSRREFLVGTKKNLTLEVSIISVMSEGEKLGTLVILHDVTREKVVERMKSEFVSIAAHQLRTPLSAIKWTLKMLLDGDLGKITDEQKGFIERTYGSNEQMIDLVNDLLNVTRIEEGRYLYKPVFADLAEIVREEIDSLEREAEKNKIVVKFKAPKEKLPKVKVDMEKIKLAIYNLVNNAISYTPKAGEVTISLYSKKEGLEFSVKDTGIGILKEQQARVFTKFFRGSNAVKKETSGSGLGLYIAKNIIESHKGRIWFESKEGEGTTFYFILPVAEIAA